MIPRLALLARDEFDYATAKADCCLRMIPRLALLARDEFD
jgi:hypothetical protein